MVRTDDALVALIAVKCFSSLDLSSDYCKIPIHEPGKQNTAFVKPD